MIAKYIRISDKSQNVDRQLNNTDRLYIDVISGKTKFLERPQAKQLVRDIMAGLIKQVTVQEVSRLGRNLIDVLQTLEYMHEMGVTIYVHNIGMYSLIDGKENPAFRMVVTILANISQTELETLRERQAEGVRKAQEKGIYKGRLKGTAMTSEERCGAHPDIVKQFNRNKRKGNTNPISLRDIAKITGTNLSTVQRVKKAYDALGGKVKPIYTPVRDIFATSNKPIYNN
ncbi:recombinase family protein [Flavobacterium daemonense]|uniref:recombinase family protein n=1 Tax=Flavobacterium daemonense TaxID=1393049 RepID=UPI001186FCAE|nr:recombinase family protein [Flavobacterium daemonense]KAF2337203.1 recombinase family protein [Flavobacterium daemonense]